MGRSHLAIGERRCGAVTTRNAHSRCRFPGFGRKVVHAYAVSVLATGDNDVPIRQVCDTRAEHVVFGVGDSHWGHLAGLGVEDGGFGEARAVAADGVSVNPCKVLLGIR